MYHLSAAGKPGTSSTRWKTTYVIASDTIKRSLNFVKAKGPATGEAVEPAAMAMLLSSRVGNERGVCCKISRRKKRNEQKSESTDKSEAEVMVAEWEDR